MPWFVPTIFGVRILLSSFFLILTANTVVLRSEATKNLIFKRSFGKQTEILRSFQSLRMTYECNFTYGREFAISSAFCELLPKPPMV